MLMILNIVEDNHKIKENGGDGVRYKVSSHVHFITWDVADEDGGVHAQWKYTRSWVQILHRTLFGGGGGGGRGYRSCGLSLNTCDIMKLFWGCFDSNKLPLILVYRGTRYCRKCMCLLIQLKPILVYILQVKEPC